MTGLPLIPPLADGETFSNPKYDYFDGSVGASFNSAFGPEFSNTYFIGLAYHHFKPAKKFFLQECGIRIKSKNCCFQAA